MQVMMKIKINGSIFILFLINHLTSGRIRFLVEQDDQFKSTENQLNQQQLNDKNEIIKRVEESNNYHRKMNELELLEFNYFNMLTNRRKKSQSIKSDNEPSSIKDQLIRPPYMWQQQPLTNEPQTSSEHKLNTESTTDHPPTHTNERFNNDQSSVQSTKQFESQFHNEQSDQFTDTDQRSDRRRPTIDKTMNTDKLDEKQSIAQPTNQSVSSTDDKRKQPNWFITMASKFGFKLIGSNDNVNTTLNQTAIKEKLNYYADYDVMMGVRIAYWLFSLFALFTLFIAYKSYCNSRKQARHQRESEKNKRKADEQGSSRRTIMPPSSVRRGSGHTSNKFVKLKTNREPDSS